MLRIGIHFFLLTLHSGCATPIEYSAFGLRPLNPIPDPKNYGGGTVNSFQPVLRWEEFPRSRDRVEDQEGLAGRISEVQYEVRVWRRGRSDFRPGSPFAGDLVYARRNLPATTHKIEVALEPGWYLWTVRAWYLLNGMQCVTDWGQQVWRSIPIKSYLWASDNRTDLFFGYYGFTILPQTYDGKPLKAPDTADSEKARESDLRSSPSF